METIGKVTCTILLCAGCAAFFALGRYFIREFDDWRDTGGLFAIYAGWGCINLLWPVWRKQKETTK